MLKKTFLLYLAIILLCGMALTPAPRFSGSADVGSISDIITKYRQEIPQRMQQENISGLAIAVVDEHDLLWAEGFGYSDWNNRVPITPDTLFSIQSMSKSFTATALMFAAQDGLVDLDAPISTYLPDFHVNSIFEEHPEQKITLRMLLSHTAGFAHEAPYGGNFDHPAYSFEKHIASISDTWLKFPVGTRYSYSNLGIDLAGYTLQVRSGEPFVQYVQEKVLDPLGMDDSTLDVKRVRAISTRAIGHVMGSPLRPPVDFLLIPSGGVWTTAQDMARYLQFHINQGALAGNRLLREDLAETMYTPPNLPANHYAQGIVVTMEHGTRRFEHGGGGFGYNSDMIWYPDLKLGAVVLCNAQLDDDFVYQLNKEILDSIIASDPVVYTGRANSAVRVEPAYLPDLQPVTLSDDALKKLIESKALPEDAAAQERRTALVGEYYFSLGAADALEISERNGDLAFSYLGSTGILTEVQPGLFFSERGDAFDFRGRTPLFTNIHVVKADPRTLPLRIALYAVCGLVFLSAWFIWPIRAIIRRFRQKSGQVNTIVAGPQRNPWLSGVIGFSVMGSLFSLICLAVVALVPSMLIVPWPRPYMDLAWWQFALLSLPFASLLLAGLIAALAGLGTKGRTLAPALRWYSLAVSLALLVFNLVVLF